MPYIYFYNCNTCDNFIVLSEGLRGWIDREGHFGRSTVFDDILNDPEGEKFSIWYDEKLCLLCNRVYSVISGNTYGVSIKEEVEIQEEDTRIHMRLLDNSDECPKCKETLLSGQEVLNKLVDRERNWLFKLPPLPEGVLPIICPLCKSDCLHYKNFWRTD